MTTHKEREIRRRAQTESDLDWFEAGYGRPVRRGPKQVSSDKIHLGVDECVIADMAITSWLEKHLKPELGRLERLATGGAYYAGHLARRQRQAEAATRIMNKARSLVRDRHSLVTRDEDDEED